MSELPQRLSIQRTAINRLETVEDVRKWLDSYIRELDMVWAKLYSQIENRGMSTQNWDIREATAADVANGDAKVAGNLITEHKTNGTKREVEA